jgi:hypothetical protein
VTNRTGDRWIARDRTGVESKKTFEQDAGQAIMAV